MTTSQPTPEEKLFAVIQGAKQPPIRPRVGPGSLRQVGARLSAAVGSVDLPGVNQALTGLLGGLAMLCVIQPLVMRPHVERLLQKTQGLSAPRLVPPLEGLRPFEEYAQAMSRADPFRIGEGAPSTAPPPLDPVEVARPDPQALIAGLKLVGISWGEEPTAMIEQNQQTYFLRAGQQLGDLTVKEVLPDRVILRADGQDVELF